MYIPFSKRKISTNIQLEFLCKNPHTAVFTWRRSLWTWYLGEIVPWCIYSESGLTSK